jgi:hypothetical protein
MTSDELNIKKETIAQPSMEIYERRRRRGGGGGGIRRRRRRRSAQSSTDRLTDEQKQRRLTSCQRFIQNYQDNPSFLY